MRIFEIAEAPIGNFTAEPGNSDAYSPSDKKLVTNPKYEKRIRNAFKNTPYNIDVVISPLKGHHGAAHHTQGEDADKIAGEIFRDIDTGMSSSVGSDYLVKPKPNVITLQIAMNLSPNNKIPLTPWTIAHKLGHSIQDKTNTKSKKFASYFKRFDSYVRRELPWQTVVAQLDIASARSGKLDNDFELFPEMMALFLIKGKIEFKSDSYAEHEDWFNDFFDTLLYEMQGHTFIGV